MNDWEAFCSSGRLDMRSTVKWVLPPNSHCSISRKMTESAFRSRVADPRNNLRCVKGADLFTTVCVIPGHDTNLLVYGSTAWCCRLRRRAGYSMQSKLTKSIGLRDGGLIGTMVYRFARVGAAVTMKLGDYFQHRNAGGSVGRKSQQASQGALPSQSRGYLNAMKFGYGWKYTRLFQSGFCHQTLSTYLLVDLKSCHPSAIYNNPYGSLDRLEDIRLKPEVSTAP